MKKLTVALIGIPAILIGSIAIAGMGPGGDRCDQDNGDKKHAGRYDNADHQQRRIDRLATHLELSDTQKEQVKAVFSAKQEQRDAMHTKMQQLHEVTRKLNPNDADYSQQLNSAKQMAADLAISKIDEQASMKAEMAKILTPEQQSKMAEMMSQFSKHEKGPRGPM